MAYFLKKTKLKNRTYLAIYESFYGHETRDTVHKSYQSFGSIESMQDKGIEDPITHVQKEVDRLNRERKEHGIKRISSISPLRHLGYFPLHGILQKLKIKRYVDLFHQNNHFSYNLYDLLSSCVYAESIHPHCHPQTFQEILPILFSSSSYSLEDILDGLTFWGRNYEKFVEIFAMRITQVYKIDISKVYFDSIDLYFGSHKEDSDNGLILIHYLTMLLQRIFQYEILHDKHSESEILSFIHNFRVIKSEHNYINTLTDNDFTRSFAQKSKLPLTEYYLSETQIKSILNYNP